MEGGAQKEDGSRGIERVQGDVMRQEGEQKRGNKNRSILLSRHTAQKNGQ